MYVTFVIFFPTIYFFTAPLGTVQPKPRAKGGGGPAAPQKNCGAQRALNSQLHLTCLERAQRAPKFEKNRSWLVAPHRGTRGSGLTRESRAREIPSKEQSSGLGSFDHD
jgi:hypothetical protein